MRCDGCGYSLWGLRERACPECGRAFSVRGRVFPPGVVEVCCPACGHGHPFQGRTAEQAPIHACAACGESLDIDAAPLRVQSGFEDTAEEAAWAAPPWMTVSWNPLAWPRAARRTLWWSCMRQQQLWRGAHAERRRGGVPAWVYLVLMTLLSGLAPTAMVLWVWWNDAPSVAWSEAVAFVALFIACTGVPLIVVAASAAGLAYWLRLRRPAVVWRYACLSVGAAAIAGAIPFIGQFAAPIGLACHLSEVCYGGSWRGCSWRSFIGILLLIIIGGGVGVLSGGWLILQAAMDFAG